MKQHLNNKGVTLVELIVSFALVATAIIYFYQTLYTVKKLYSQSQKETNEFVKVNYAYRIIDELNNTFEDEGNNDLCKKIKAYKDNDNNFLAEVEDTGCIDEENTNTNFKKVDFTISGKEYSMYFYNES